MAKRGRTPKEKEPTTLEVGDFIIREIEGKYLIYMHGSIRAIRHTEQEAREYIGLVS